MGTISLSIPVAGQPNSTEDPKIATDLTTIQTGINGNLDGDNLSSSTDQALSLNDSSNTRRGKKIVATQEAAPIGTYGTLATADSVAGIVLPTNGIIHVLYQARYTVTGTAAGTGAFMTVFLGATQAQVHMQSPQNGVVGVLTGNLPNNTFANLDLGLTVASATSYGGIVTLANGFLGNTTALSGSDPTTGVVMQVPFMPFYAAGGTYTVSIQFKRDSAKASAFSLQDRRLFVKAEAF